MCYSQFLTHRPSVLDMGHSSLIEGQKGTTYIIQSYTHSRGSPCELPNTSKSKIQKVGKEKLTENLKLSGESEKNLSPS